MGSRGLGICGRCLHRVLYNVVPLELLTIPDNQRRGVRWCFLVYFGASPLCTGIGIHKSFLHHPSLARTK